MSSPHRRPTIDDVAAAAGVSRGTVSRVLNGGHWVSPSSLEAVEAAINKTGYRINPHARSLATARAGSVAFLLTEPHAILYRDPNFSELMRGAAQALSEQDIPLVLLMAGSADEQRRAIDFIAAGHVDGVLLVSSHAETAGFIRELAGLKAPVISCGVPFGSEQLMRHVESDDAAGAVEAVSYLRSIGRTRIATITGPLDSTGGVDRLAGYRAAVGDGYDPAIVATGEYTEESGERGMAEILAADPDVDAVFAANDAMAAGALRQLERAGRRVPEDVAVVGFDDSCIAERTTPPLTTMRQPFERISQEMVRILLEEIGGHRAESVKLPTELVRRESA